MFKSAIALSAGMIVATLASAQNLTLERHTIHDPMAVNREALSFHKPRGWKVDGGVRWYLNLAHQACVETRVFNPDGLEQIETMPWAMGVWITNTVVPLQRGSNYQGCIVLEPIESPREFVERVTIPYLRSGGNVRVVDSQDQPEIARQVSRANGGVAVRSARVRIEYSFNGQDVEEDIYVSLSSTRANIGGGSVSTMWGPAWPPFALRAAKGKLDSATPLMMTVLNSTRVNPYWFAEYKFVCDLFANRMNVGIRNAKEISDYITRNNEQIRRMFADSYQARQESQDRLSRQYSDLVRGVQRFDSPFENHPVHLPSAYKHAWAGRNGEFVLSNDSGFDPNVGSTTSWKLLTETR